MADKPVLSIDDLEYQSFGHGERFEARRAAVSEHIGGQKLGYGVVVLGPGKRAWPYHSHYVNEELFFVLEGEGTLRHAGEEYPIKTGDFIAAPADSEQPHQIVNSSEADLKYVCISTMQQPEIALYPDSEKFGVYHGDFRNMDAPGSFFLLGRRSNAIDYWDGED